jgi:hypothetical protein
MIIIISSSLSSSSSSSSSFPVSSTGTVQHELLILLGRNGNLYSYHVNSGIKVRYILAFRWMYVVCMYILKYTEQNILMMIIIYILMIRYNNGIVIVDDDDDDDDDDDYDTNALRYHLLNSKY